jgi:hypothetical protein
MIQQQHISKANKLTSITSVYILLEDANLEQFLY